MENHSVTIENRETLTVTDIKEIDSFDEEEVRATLVSGAMIIRGKKLHIRMLDLDSGRAVIVGIIASQLSVRVREKGETALCARLMK